MTIDTLRLPVRLRFVRAQAAAQVANSRPAAASCRASTLASVDLQFLRAMPLIDRQMDRDGIDRAFDEAQSNNGWLIFYGHDVSRTAEPLWLLARPRSRMRSKRRHDGKFRL